MSHRYLILGLLAKNPMSGYDIHKHANEVLNTAIQTSYGTLYPMLHKLLAEGAVQVEEVDQDNRPMKKLYRITGRGRADLEAWLERPANGDKVRREFLLKVYLAKDIADHAVVELLARRRDDAQQLVEHLRRKRDSCQDLQQIWMLDYELSLCQAEIGWIKRMEKQINRA